MINYQFSVHQADDSRKWSQFLCAFSATILAFVCGTSMGWYVTARKELLNPDNSYFLVGYNELHWIGSALFLSAACTCIPCGCLIYLIGRKWSMLLLTLPALVGWALILFAKNFLMMLLGRIFLGITVGGAFVIVPVYIGEIAQSEIRGTLGTMFQLLVTIGILFVKTIGAYVDVFGLTLICLILPIIFAVVFVWMPESPTYLVYRGKLEQAEKSFGFLRGWTHDNHAEIERLKYEEEQRQLVNLLVRFRRIEARKALMIITGLYVFHQLCGINVVLFHHQEIYGKAFMDPGYQRMNFDVIQVVMNLVSVLVADIFGRKTMLFLSQMLMAITILWLGVYFFVEETVPLMVWLTINSLKLFLIGYSVQGPYVHTMIGEICAPDIKGLAIGFVASIYWFLFFCMNYVLYDLQPVLDIHSMFWIYSGFSFFGAAFVYFCVPETKGKSLNAIQRMLAGIKEPQKDDEREDDENRK